MKIKLLKATVRNNELKEGFFLERTLGFFFIILENKALQRALSKQKLACQTVTQDIKNQKI